MFDALVNDLSQRYGLGDRGRDLFGLLVAYVHNERRGGFPGFIEGFREQGHGELVSSWLGNPDAGGLTASDVGMVFGQGLLNDWGNRLGVSRATVGAAIAGVLPRLVAELTPGGRIPGGFAPLSPQGSDRGAPPRIESRTRAATPDASHDPAPVREAASFASPMEQPRPAPEPADPGRLVPADERDAAAAARRFEPGIDASAEARSAPSLRREPPAAARAPVDARPMLDPGEQRVAEMAAAFDRPAATAGAATPDARPDHWRPAMQPPRRKRRSGGLVWLVLLLALLGGGWFAWSQGLLAPYIQQFQLPVQAAPSTR